MSLMKVTDCTHLAYFWPISYDHTRAVQLQKPTPFAFTFNTHSFANVLPCLFTNVYASVLQVFPNLKRLCCTCTAVYFCGAAEVPFHSRTGFILVKGEMGFLPTWISIGPDAQAGGFATQNSLKWWDLHPRPGTGLHFWIHQFRYSLPLQLSYFYCFALFIIFVQ